MSKQIKSFWIVAAFIIALIIVVSKIPAYTPNAIKSKEESITIGVLLPLTGDGASYGIQLRRSAEMAIAEINQAGGIDKQEIEAIFEDGQCNSEKALSAAQKLINIDKVNIIMGGVCLEEILPVASLAETAKVLVISPSITNPDLTKSGNFIFRTIPSDSNAAIVAAEYAYNKISARKVAIISEMKDYSQGLRHIFKDSFTALGGTILADETYNTDNTNLKVQLLKIKIQAPDLIYLIPQTSTSGIQILDQLNANDIQINILTTDTLMKDEIVAKNFQNMKGVMGLEQFFDKNNILAKNMLKKYEDKFGEPILLPIAQTNFYSQFYLIKEAIEKVGANTEELRDYLYKLKDWKHALGTLNFDKNGDPIGLPYVIKKVDNGKLAIVEIFKPITR